MAIVTTRLIMFKLVEGAKHCFEVEQVEVTVFIEEVDERHLDFLDLVCKRTKDTIFTVIEPERELVTELGPVLDGSIQLFYIIVTIDAVIPFRTLHPLFYSFAYLA